MSTQPQTSSEIPIKILNEQAKKGKCKKSAAELSKEMQKVMQKMKGAIIAEDGSWVKYDVFKKHKLYKQYMDIANTLADISLTSFSEPEKIAFFINVYNCLTIHGVAAQDGALPASILNIRQFWRTTAYIISGLVFSLDDIEHGILRCNRPHPASKDKPFKPNDPRLAFVAKEMDPRLHFALVCGAKSCPVINVYTADRLNETLDIVTRQFLRHEVRVLLTHRQIQVPPFFQWYWSDFGSNDVEAVRWSKRYLDDSDQRDLENLLVTLEAQGMVDIQYKNFNWNLNQCEQPQARK